MNRYLKIVELDADEDAMATTVCKPGIFYTHPQMHDQIGYISAKDCPLVWCCLSGLERQMVDGNPEAPANTLKGGFVSEEGLMRIIAIIQKPELATELAY